MRLIPVIFVTAWASVAQSADISVRLQGAPTDGVLVFQVYDSPNAFGDLRDPVKEMHAPVKASNLYLVDDVPVGDVAVLVYVDKNRNGLMDKNFIGIPKEPLGISNNYRPKGPPTFRRAKFTISGGESITIDIELYKVLGERGRFGLGPGFIGRSSPYIGSDTTVLQPIPAVTYIGERLQWLGPNVQYSFLGTGRWRLAASASYRIGVYEESDSPALSGLDDRDGTLMAGLGFRLELPGGTDLSLRYEHDVLNKIGGGAATATVSRDFQIGLLRLAPQLQMNWLGADLTNHDFGVPPGATTPTRPAYATGSSISYEAGVTSFIEVTEDWGMVLSLSAEFLPNEITDSPIVGDDRIVKGFAGITYIF